MSNKPDKPHGPEGIVIIVNGTPTETGDATVTFEEVTALAFPSDNPGQLTYTVTYRNSADHHGPGVLRAGEAVHVKNRGTVFDVSPTTES